MADGQRRIRGSRWKRGLQIVAAGAVVLVGAFAVGSAVAGPFFWYPCSLNGLEAHGPAHASVLLARDGTRLGMLGASGVRLPVTFQKVSPVMRQAIIDTEDRIERFLHVIEGIIGSGLAVTERVAARRYGTR